jgi:hypothetical protein
MFESCTPTCLLDLSIEAIAVVVRTPQTKHRLTGDALSDGVSLLPHLDSNQEPIG